MSVNQNKIKGGVLFLGSLFWEDETSAIQKNTNGVRLAKERRKWREKFLVIDETSVQQVPLPIGYGRKSNSREDTFTMVLTRHYWNNKGKGLIAPYIETINFSNFNSFKKQVKELASVEGIYRPTNTSTTQRDNTNTYFVDSFGAVAIYINPKSSDKTQNKIKELWNRVIKDEKGNYINGYDKNINDFAWKQGDSLLATDYILSQALIIDTELDFLFLTYIKPNYKNAQNQRDYPTAQIIGEAMKKYCTYFFQNNISKIITTEDDEIFKHIPKTL
ncbi:MAG: hypothetical protein MUC29_11180 [Pyrinomonadaceae bacterium]|nr:hypothetical protein [Pyrinomonadaceae bacterium]